MHRLTDIVYAELEITVLRDWMSVVHICKLPCESQFYIYWGISDYTSAVCFRNKQIETVVLMLVVTISLTKPP